MVLFTFMLRALPRLGPAVGRGVTVEQPVAPQNLDAVLISDYDADHSLQPLNTPRR